jgi:hypothetical protein
MWNSHVSQMTACPQVAANRTGTCVGIRPRGGALFASRVKTTGRNCGFEPTAIGAGRFESAQYSVYAILGAFNRGVQGPGPVGRRLDAHRKRAARCIARRSVQSSCQRTVCSREPSRFLNCCPLVVFGHLPEGGASISVMNRNSERTGGR